MHSDDSPTTNSDSSSSTKSSEPEASKLSPENSESCSGESPKSSPRRALWGKHSQPPSDSSATQSIASLISQSLAIQESQALSLEDREKDARAKAHAMTWGNPLWLASRKRQADVGKEPQWLSERGAGFDKKIETPPPPIRIAIQQVFSDGTKNERLVTIGVEGQQ